MAWPTPQDYNEAIQNPTSCFADADLRAGTPELTALGLPRPITGNFASVYRMHCGQRDWAVRCLFREYADMADRYEAISRHLSAARLPYTVGFEFLDQGIRVRNAWYPAVKMEWVEGELLHAHIERHRLDSRHLRNLAGAWLQMTRALGNISVAHGDLQHGNVLVVDGELRLVDYDGMFVPPLAGRTSHEIGHVNYQHPRRTGADFGPWLDRFSAWIIYISLLGISERPDLWDELSAGDECLLFRRADLLDPGASQAFALLRAQPDRRLRSAVSALETSLSRSPADVPPLAPAPAPRPASLPTRPVPDWLTPSPVACLPPPACRRAAYLWTALAALLLAAGFVGPVPWALAASVLVTGCGLLLIAGWYSLHPACRARRRRRLQLWKAQWTLRRLDRRIGSRLRTAQRLEYRHQRRLQALEESLAALTERERREASEIREAMSAMLSTLGAALEELQQARRGAMDARLRRARERHAERVLRRARVRSAPVRPSLRLQLWMRGIRCAHDVSSRRRELLVSMEATDAVDVLSWRLSVEAAGKKSAPNQLRRHEIYPLQAESGRYERRLARTRQRLETRRDALLAASYDRHARERERIDDRVKRSAERYARRRGVLDAEVETLRRDVPLVSRRIAEARRGLEPYRAVTFRRYLWGLLPHARARSTVP